MTIQNKSQVTEISRWSLSASGVEGGLRTSGTEKALSCTKPLITIVTVVYNDVTLIAETIESILNQTYDNVEYIVVDGGSTDGTLEIIKSYDDHIDYWISDKDGGIYDGMNRGIQLAQGDIIGLINSGDYLHTNALEEIALAYTPQIWCYYSDVTIVFDKMDFTIVKPASFTYWKGMPICHQALFVSRFVYETKGLYNTENYDLISDYDLFLQLYLDKDSRFEYVPQAIIYSREGKSSQKMMFKLASESLRVAMHRLPFDKKILFLGYWSWDLARGITRTLLFKVVGDRFTGRIRELYHALFSKVDRK